MKKLLSTLLVFVFVLSLCACGNSKSNVDGGVDEIKDVNEDIKEESTATEGAKEIYSVGDTIKTDVFNVTLTDLQFVDSITCETNNSDVFFNPSTEGDKLLTGGDNYSLLYYTFKYEFVGKSDLDNLMICDHFLTPCVNYLDYSIDDNYFSYVLIPDKPWYALSTDVDWNVQKNYGIALGTLKYTYEPLEDKEYYVRGAISIPSKAKNDSESEMSITFQILSSMTDSNYVYDGYTFTVR